MKKRIVAVILAAGYSSRMGAFKPLLPLGETTVVQRCIDLFGKAGIDDIRVVIGHRAQDMRAALAHCNVPCIFNPDYDDGMFSSVITGIRNLPASTKAFFILPVDIPLIRPLTPELLMDAFHEHPALIIHPCFQGERGHPPLIDMQCAPTIIGWRGPMGLKGALHPFEKQTIEVEVPDAFILQDMDRPENYQHLLKHLCDYSIPSEPECDILLKRVFSVKERVVRHGRAVAQLALHFGRLLNAAGESLNLKRLGAAGRLHDLAKGQPEHALSGARILRKMGFPEVADIVAVHMEIDPGTDDIINEAQLIYLADKMIHGERLVADYSQRFYKKLENFKDRPDIQANIVRRLKNARIIQGRMEKRLSRSLKDIIEKPEALGNEKRKQSDFNTSATLSYERF